MRAIVFLVDSSGSMDERLDGRRKIELVSEAMLDLLSDEDLLPGEDLASIMLFHATKWGDVPKIDLISPLTSLNELRAELDRIRKKLGKVKPVGGTPIGFGISSAVETLVGVDASEKRIILITDGENNVGVPPGEIALEADRHGIRIDVIGIGDEINPLELEDVAEKTGGVFRRFPSDGSIHELLRGLVAEPKPRIEKLKIEEAEELSKLLAELSKIDEELGSLTKLVDAGKLSLDEYSKHFSELEFRKRELMAKIRDLRSELSKRLIEAQMRLAGLEEGSPEAEELRQLISELKSLLERSEVG